MSNPDYDFTDYRDAFLVAVEASIGRKGIFMADDNAFKSLADNAHGVAVAAAKRLQVERKLHAIEALSDLKRSIMKATGSANPSRMEHPDA